MTIENAHEDFDSAFDEVAGNEQVFNEQPVIEEVIDDLEVDDEGAIEPEAREEPEVSEEPINIWAEAPDEQRIAYEKLVTENNRLSHQRNSDAGRVGALQRKVNELQSVSNAVGDTPSAQDIVKAMQSPEDMAAFKSEYPDMDDAIESRIAMKDVETQKLIQQRIDEALTPFRDEKVLRDQALATEQANQQDAALEREHGNWKEIVASTEFSVWLDNQPAVTKELIHSEAAEDAAALIGYFKSSQPQGNYSDNHTQGGNNVTEIQRKRQKQLNDSAGIRSKSTRASNGQSAPDDFDAAFDMYADS